MPLCGPKKRINKQPGLELSSCSPEEPYDQVADEYARRISGELQHKPFDRELLNRFAAAVTGRGEVCDMGGGPGHIARYPSTSSTGGGGTGGSGGNSSGGTSLPKLPPPQPICTIIAASRPIRMPQPSLIGVSTPPNKPLKTNSGLPNSFQATLGWLVRLWSCSAKRVGR
jgi:hypothetical protein